MGYDRSRKTDDGSVQVCGTAMRALYKMGPGFWNVMDRQHITSEIKRAAAAKCWRSRWTPSSVSLKPSERGSRYPAGADGAVSRRCSFPMERSDEYSGLAGSALTQGSCTQWPGGRFSPRWYLFKTVESASILPCSRLLLYHQAVGQSGLRVCRSG